MSKLEKYFPAFFRIAKYRTKILLYFPGIIWGGLACYGLACTIWCSTILSPGIVGISVYRDVREYQNTSDGGLASLGTKYSQVAFSDEMHWEKWEREKFLPFLAGPEFVLANIDFDRQPELVILNCELVTSSLFMDSPCPNSAISAIYKISNGRLSFSSCDSTIFSFYLASRKNFLGYIGKLLFWAIPLGILQMFIAFCTKSHSS